MPYIKKDMRATFDSAIALAVKGRLGEASTVILVGVKDLPESSFDGCLNYAFTQLLRKVRNVLDAETVIQMTIYDIFLKEPRYYKLERLVGLLTCMIEEFKRRKWIVLSDVVPVLRRLRKSVILNHLIPYENKKIEQSGDLE